MTARYCIDGQILHAPRLAPGLHIVSTPIGNLGDITLRALQALAAADAVIVEDSRVTRTLLSHYGINRPMLVYHEHNAQEALPHLVQRLADGQALALVSDAGTPLVSDPGYRLIDGALKAGIAVTAAPGASAVLAALVIAGLPTDRFFFEGFLPPRQGERKRQLRSLAEVPATLVLYEAPHRLVETLEDMADVFGPRAAAVARELTKKFETVQRGTLPELAAHYRDHERPRGEIVILIQPGSDEAGAPDGATLDERITAALETMSPRDAATVVAAALGLPRRQVYGRVTEIAAQGRDGEA